MGINRQVFGSAPEKRAFQKLSRTWGHKYHIYHNLPFLNVLNTDGLIDFHGDFAPFFISSSDKTKLKKTSIDFTLCDDNDAPILCIEFDGLRKGFNVGPSYASKVSGAVRPGWRKTITELKLKVSHGSNFPYLVLGSQFFEEISSKVQLTIVDAIIGDILATRETREILANGFRPEDAGFSQETFNALSQSDRHEIIQDWVISVEVESDMKHNPVCSLAAQLQVKLGINLCSFEFLSHPNISDSLSLDERVDAIKSSLMNGARCIVTDKKGRKFRGEAWIPNSNSPGFSGYGMLSDLAQLIALDKALRNKPGPSF